LEACCQANLAVRLSAFHAGAERVAAYGRRRDRFRRVFGLQNLVGPACGAFSKGAVVLDELYFFGEGSGMPPRVSVLIALRERVRKSVAVGALVSMNCDF